MEAKRSFKTSVGIYESIERNITEDFKFYEELSIRTVVARQTARRLS